MSAKLICELLAFLHLFQAIIGVSVFNNTNVSTSVSPNTNPLFVFNHTIVSTSVSPNRNPLTVFNNTTVSTSVSPNTNPLSVFNNTNVSTSISPNRNPLSIFNNTTVSTSVSPNINPLSVFNNTTVSTSVSPNTNPSSVFNNTTVSTSASPTTNPLDLPNIECEAYEDITSTDTKNFKYYPYYVKLFRCQGADLQPPTHRSCIASHIQEVTVNVHESGVYKVITLFNHTQCVYNCTKNSSSCTNYQKWNIDTCQCDCDPAKKAICTLPMKWETSHCCACPQIKKSQCAQRKDKTFNNTICQCVDDEVKRAETKNCQQDSNSVGISIVVIIVFLELIIVVGVCLAAVYFCRHRQKKRTNSLVHKIELSNKGYANSNSNLMKTDENTSQANYLSMNNKV